MATPGFYNANIGRDYPFVDSEAGGDPLPDCAVADIGVVMIAATGFIAGTHSVYLDSISRSGSTFTFSISSDATGIDAESVAITRQITDERYLTGFYSGDDEHLDSSTSSELLCAGPLWELFFVSGDMAELAELLDDGNTLTGPWRLEPSLVQNLEGSVVRSITVVNADRTRATAPAECRDYCWPFEPQDYYVQCECVTGDVLFGTGFNLDLEQDADNNAISFEAGVGLGLGETCGDVAVFDDESAAINRTTFDGGLKCSEVLQSINGVSRQFFQILGGDGVIVSALPDQNRIVIDVNLLNLALCADLPEEEAVSLSENDSSECACGPS